MHDSLPIRSSNMTCSNCWINMWRTLQSSSKSHVSKTGQVHLEAWSYHAFLVPEIPSSPPPSFTCDASIDLSSRRSCVTVGEQGFSFHGLWSFNCMYLYIYKSYIRYCGINILGCIKRYFTAHVPQQNPLSCSSALRGQPWSMAAFTLVAYRVVTRLPKRSPHWEPLVGDRSCLRWQWSPAQRREGNDKPAMTGNDLYHL